MSLDEIRAFWKAQAEANDLSPSSSWADHPAIDLEIRTISKHLNDGERVLDVGCGTGYSTLALAVNRQVRIKGLDYIPEMIDRARRRLIDAEESVRGRVEFDCGDATKLPEHTGTYDAVVATRVLCNLGSWVNQTRALRECMRVLRHAGRLVASEPTVQGWQRLNELRAEWALPPIPVPPFNTYLDENLLGMLPGLRLRETVDFASTYFVGTRVLKPLLVRALNLDVDVANGQTHWNRWFATLPAAGDYGIHKLFVFESAGGTSARLTP